ncbi:hypothetical protein A6R68_15690, partial [Neotoma lepida]
SSCERGLHQVSGVEKRDHYVTVISNLDQTIDINPDTKEILKLLDFGSICILCGIYPTVEMNFKTPQGSSCERGLHQVSGVEKRDHYVTVISNLDQTIDINPDTKEILKLLDFGSICILCGIYPTVEMNFKTPQG